LLRASGRGFRRLLAPVVSAVALVASACSSSGGSPSSPDPTRSSVPASPSPTIAIGGLTGTILFARAGGKYADQTIYSVGVDGSDERRITPFGGQCCPRWSPDGTHILVSALAADGQRITTGIMDRDGLHERKIPLPGTLNLGPGAWSADGTHLAFEGWSDAKSGLQGVYVARASDGKGLVRVTTCTKVQDDRPFAFSPDGSKVFFWRAVSGFPAVGDQQDGSVFVVDAEGRDLRPVTPPDLPVEVPGDVWGRLSADGRWIVFVSTGDIWTIRADGSGLTKVFDDPQGRIAIAPTWSPDGRFILFGLDPRGSLAVIHPAGTSNCLYIIRADGTELTPMLVSDDFKGGPDWTAGG
jgi:Tol biopolymer transport system component